MSSSISYHFPSDHRDRTRHPDEAVTGTIEFTTSYRIKHILDSMILQIYSIYHHPLPHAPRMTPFPEPPVWLAPRLRPVGTSKGHDKWPLDPWQGEHPNIFPAVRSGQRMSKIKGTTMDNLEGPCCWALHGVTSSCERHVKHVVRFGYILGLTL